MNQPVISIITVCYNCAELLEGTIQSVLAQSYSSIEYLIIDGNSSDHTVEILQKYESKLKWISEPDKGLYDAMNKGLKMATGDFVWFMNAGDHCSTPDIVEKMMQLYTSETDVLYGEIMMVDENRNPVGTRSEITPHKLPNPLTWKSNSMGMIVSHQAFLPRLSIAPQYMDGNLAADIDWVIECLKKSRKTTATNLILAHFLLGGTSRQRHTQSLKDRFSVLRMHFGLIPTLWNHFLIVGRAVFHKVKRKGKVSY